MKVNCEIECKCGCKQIKLLYDVNGIERLYISGHNRRGIKYTDKHKKLLSDIQKSITNKGRFKKSQKSWNYGTRGICNIVDCNESHHAKGYCLSHYGKENYKKKFGWKKLGDKKRVAWNKGIPMTKEAKIKLSKSKKGISIPWNKDKRKKTKYKYENEFIYCKCGCGEILLKFDRSDRIRKYIFGHSGRNKSEKTRNKLSISMKDRYKNGYVNNRKDSVTSEETKQKMRESQWNHKVTYIKKSKPERFLESILAVNGIKYETQKSITGRPDFFIKPNICIFEDGCYHHGCNLHNSKEKLLTKVPQKGINRDKIVNKSLKSQGYIVIRIWEHEVYDDPIGCLEKMTKYV